MPPGRWELTSLGESGQNLGTPDMDGAAETSTAIRAPPVPPDGGVRQTAGSNPEALMPEPPDTQEPRGAARSAAPSNPGEESPQRQAVATTSQQSILSYGVTAVYWERQEGGAMYALHATSNLLQRPATTRERLHAIAGQLDERERFLLNGNNPGEGGNRRPDGDYTIQVITEALGETDQG